MLGAEPPWDYAAGFGTQLANLGRTQPTNLGTDPADKP